MEPQFILIATINALGTMDANSKETFDRNRTYVWARKSPSEVGWSEMLHGMRNSIAYGIIMCSAAACAIRDEFIRHNLGRDAACFIVPVRETSLKE